MYVIFRRWWVGTVMDDTVLQDVLVDLFVRSSFIASDIPYRDYGTESAECVQ